MGEVSAKVSLDMADLQADLERFTGTYQELIDMLQKEHKTATENMSERRTHITGIADADADMAKEHATSSDKIVKDTEKVISKYQALRKAMLEAGKSGTMTGGVQGGVGEMMPAQLGGMQSGLKSLKTSVLKELPAGGLVGLMMLGGTREEETRAMGSRIARMFQQTGQVGRREMAEVGAATRDLGVMLGKGPTGMQAEVAATASMFAQAGIDIKQTLETSFMGPMGKAGESVLMTSVRLDSLFKLGAGTSARTMSQMVRDFNMDATESAKVMAGIALSARDSGTSVMAFTTSVMRSAAALRTQRVDITEVAEAQLKFQKALQAGGLGKEFAAGYAERAVAQITQGLSGMGVGLSAVLGERITTRQEAEGVEGARKVEGLEAYYAIREGFGGKEGKEGKGMFAESIVELGKMAAEGNRTEVEQRFFLEKVAKTGFEGSKAIVALHASIKGGMDVDEAIELHEKELKGAFKSRAEETSTFQRSLMKMQDGIAKIGAGILSAVITGFKILATGIQWMMAKSDLFGSANEAKFREEQLLALFDAADVGFKLLGKGLEDTFSSIGDAASAVTGQEKGKGGAQDESYEARQISNIMSASSGISREEAIQRYKAKQGQIEVGKGTGAFIDKEDEKETKIDAQELMMSRSKDWMENMLSKFTTASDKQIVNILRTYETGEKRTRYGTGGEEDVAKYIEHQETIGAGIRRKGGGKIEGIGGLGTMAEEKASMTTTDIGGKKLTLQVIVKALSLEDKISKAKIDA